MRGRKRTNRASPVKGEPSLVRTEHSRSSQSKRVQQVPCKNIKSAQFVDSSDDDSDHAELIKVGGVSDIKENRQGSSSVDSDGSGKSGGCGLKGGANKSDNTQFRDRMLKSTSSDSTTDGCGQVGVATVNGGSSEDTPVKQLQPVAKQPQRRRKLLDVSPLSLLSDASSSEVGTDEVSLSDLDGSTKGDEGVVTVISGCGSSSGMSVHSVAGSNLEEGEPIMKKKLSLKSKKSWQLSRAEYGREGSSDIGKGSGDTSTTDNEGGKGSGGVEERSPKRKKKKVKKAKYGSQKRRYSSGTDLDSSVEKKKKPKTEEGEEEEEGDSDEVGGAKQDLVKHRKRHCPVFSSSSDEGGHHNTLESLLTSSEDELIIVPAPPIPDSHAQSIEFHLERASSDESGLDSLTPLKKKRKARIVSVSSASSEGSVSCQIINNSSDEFEDLKRFRSQPIRHGLVSLISARKREKKRKKLSKKKRGFSDEEEGEGMVTPSSSVKEEGSSEEDDKTNTPSEERVNNTKD